MILESAGRLFARGAMVIALVSVTVGCQSEPRQPDRPLTPLEACMQEVRDRSLICFLNSYSAGRPGYPAVAQAQQVCEDRKMMQEDRCYARFKR